VWVTSPAALPLLSHNPFIADVKLIKDAVQGGIQAEFDLVMNLEDEPRCAELASTLKRKTIIGPSLSGGHITYHHSNCDWFDMSLISRFGKARADELKMANRKSYQEFLFAMAGLSFRGEEAVLNLPLGTTAVPGLIGIESRAGDVWPMKRWSGYEELAARLSAEGFRVKFFVQREKLEDYINDINECEFIICGDTLAMHLGLALRKKIVAIFTCTSPHEIYGYGRLVKIISPLWEKYFYRRDFAQEAVDAISVDSVHEAITNHVQ
jgi:heptosyltransferase-2